MLEENGFHKYFFNKKVNRLYVELNNSQMIKDVEEIFKKGLVFDIKKSGYKKGDNNTYMSAWVPMKAS